MNYPRLGRKLTNINRERELKRFFAPWWAIIKMVNKQQLACALTEI